MDEMGKRRTLMTVGWLVVAVVSLPFVVPIFVPWYGINSRQESINIKTGEARYSSTIWFIKVSERIEDTPLSDALQGSTVDVADIEPWHPVNTFSPGTKHSPHYRFHGALHQASQLTLLENLTPLTPARKKEIATEILTSWQKSGHYRGAEDYINDLLQGALDDLE